MRQGERNMKKILTGMLLAALLLSGCSGCAKKSAEAAAVPPARVQIGVVLIDAEDAAASEAQREGVEQALESLGMQDTQVVWRFEAGEEQELLEALQDCVDAGCNLIFTNPHTGRQRPVEQAAQSNPETEFVAVGGDTAKTSGLANLHNVSPRLFEAQYVAGIAAGLKLQELAGNGELGGGDAEEDVSRLGYVAAFPNAEAISAYTAYFLGARSVCEELTMTVRYLNAWQSDTAEYEAANALLDAGCVVLGCDAAASGVALACSERREDGANVFCAADLNAAQAKWPSVYAELIDAFRTGKTLPTDWSAGFDRDAVGLTQTGDAAAVGTADAQKTAIDGLKDGSLQIFATDAFTVDGKTAASAFVTDTDGDLIADQDEAIYDGAFHECVFRSAPYFTLHIDGITEAFD